MALIKSSQADRIVKKSFLDFKDLKAQAEQVLAEARAEADRILAEARAEARRLAEAAAPRGHSEGREQGLAEGRAQGEQVGREEALAEHRERLAKLLESWSRALAEWESQRNVMLLAAREDVLALALAMGRRVTRRIIDADPSVVTDQVAEALKLVLDPSHVQVSVHPDDLPLVESVLAELVESIGASANVELREDPSVERGGCVLSTGKGMIDATVERQLERITETLMARTPTSTSEPTADGAAAE